MQHTPGPSLGCVVSSTSQHRTSQFGRRQREKGTNYMSGDPSRSTPVMASPVPPEAKHGRPSQNASAQPSRMRAQNNASPSNGNQGSGLVDADSGIDRVPTGTRALSKGKRKEEEVVHRDLGSNKEALPTKALTKPRGITSSSAQPKTSASVDQDRLSLRSWQSFVSSGCHSSHEHQDFTIATRC